MAEGTLYFRGNPTGRKRKLKWVQKFFNGSDSFEIIDGWICFSFKGTDFKLDDSSWGIFPPGTFEK